MIFDIAVLFVLLVSAAIAFLRGFIREVLTIIGVLGGLAAAYFGGPILSPIVRGWFDAGTEEAPKKLFDILPYDVLADLLAYGFIFVIVVVLLSLVSHLLSGWAKAIGLGAVDRTLGVIFGLVRGVVILGLLYLPASIVIEKKVLDEWFGASKTHFYVAATADAFMKILPDSVRENTKDNAESAAETMAETTRKKLQNLDILGGLGDEKDAEEGAPSDKDAIEFSSGEEGYQRNQRLNMNELIEDSVTGAQGKNRMQNGDYNE